MESLLACLLVLDQEGKKCHLVVDSNSDSGS